MNGFGSWPLVPYFFLKPANSACTVFWLIKSVCSHQQMRKLMAWNKDCSLQHGQPGIVLCQRRSGDVHQERTRKRKGRREGGKGREKLFGTCIIRTIDTCQ